MKKKIFAIGMSLLLITALVPLVGGAVSAQDTGFIGEIPAIIGLDVSPSSIDFGVIPPGGSSPTDPGDRTVTAVSTANCDQWVTTEVLGEERTVVGEKLGHGDGTTTVFGPTDYIPIIDCTYTVYLDGVEQIDNHEVDCATGLLTFDSPPAGGLLVTIDYESVSTLFSSYMNFNDPAAPPEVLAASYARELVDDQTATILTDIYPPLDYPVGVETAQVVFYVEAIVGTYYTLTMEAIGSGTTEPSLGVHSYPEGEVVTITATPSEGWYFVEWLGPVADPGASTTTVTMDDDRAVTASFAAMAGPEVSIVSPSSLEVVSGMVSIEALATDDMGIIDGQYSVDSLDPGDFVSMTPDVALPATPVTFTADWDSTTVADGVHTIYVGVVDTDMMYGLTSVDVSVNNDGPTEWTYDCTYVDPQLVALYGSDTQVTYWVKTYDGIEYIDTGVFAGDCIKLITDYGDPPPTIFRGGIQAELFSMTNWYDVATGRLMYEEGSVSAFGFIVSTYRTLEWLDADTYLVTAELDPPVGTVDPAIYDVVITGTELVMTAAGDFMCDVIETWMIENPAGTPITPVLTMTDYVHNGTPSSGVIQRLDFGYDGDMTVILTSITDPGA
jgi:hypothetical protein